MKRMQVDNSGQCSYGVNKCFCFVSLLFLHWHRTVIFKYFLKLSLLVPHVYECMTKTKQTNKQTKSYSASVILYIF